MYSTTGATSHLFFLKLVIWHPLQSEKTGCFYAAAVTSVENQQRLGFVLINPRAETLNWHEQECSLLKVHRGQDRRRCDEEGHLQDVHLQVDTLKAGY